MIVSGNWILLTTFLSGFLGGVVAGAVACCVWIVWKLWDRRKDRR